MTRHSGKFLNIFVPHNKRVRYCFTVQSHYGAMLTPVATEEYTVSSCVVSYYHMMFVIMIQWLDPIKYIFKVNTYPLQVTQPCILLCRSLVSSRTYILVQGTLLKVFTVGTWIYCISCLYCRDAPHSIEYRNVNDSNTGLSKGKKSLPAGRYARKQGRHTLKEPSVWPTRILEEWWYVCGLHICR